MLSTLSFNQCLQSPCAGCAAPCCTYLPLHDFSIQRFQDADYARYLLNFANIELALVNGATWRVHYTMRCARLTEEGLCGLHGHPSKPQVCLNYDAYGCFYRPMFLEKETPNFMRFDHNRFAALLEHLEFSSDGHLQSMPSPDELLKVLPPFVAQPTIELPVPKPVLESKSGRSFQEVQRQCEGCSAWCCQTLSFPFGGIESTVNMDYLWFCLGFSGVELCITETTMSIFVHTRCRHLDNVQTGGCTVFGTAQRPLLCQQYDGMNCAYRVQVGTRNPSQSIRLGLSEFGVLEQYLTFDQAGQRVGEVPFDLLRVAVHQAKIEPLDGLQS